MAATLTPAPKTVKTSPPFRLAEEGWGEFEMLITLTAVGKSETFDLAHDLNFVEERYAGTNVVVSLAPSGGASKRDPPHELLD